MFRYQRGMTFLGLLIIAMLVGVIFFAGVKLTPVYMQHMKLVAVLEDTKAELDGQNASGARIRNSIEKRLNIEAIRTVPLKEFKITKQGAGYLVNLDYQTNTSFIANVSFLVSFDKSVEILR